MKRIIASVLAVSFVAGCAQKASNIDAAYVSSRQFAGMSCGDLAAEANAINARLASISGKQDKAASNDAALTAVTLILFWPAAFAIPAGDDYEGEISHLKGQANALRGAALQKGCS